MILANYYYFSVTKNELNYAIYIYARYNGNAAPRIGKLIARMRRNVNNEYALIIYTKTRCNGIEKNTLFL